MYSQEITRCHRTAIVIAIDQSSSMSGRMELNGESLSKADVVAMVTGRLIDELIMRSYSGDGYRYYYDIAVIGYSDNRLYPLLGETEGFYPITTLASQKRVRISYKLPYNTLNGGVNAFCESVPMWVEPRAEGNTPMYKMLNHVTELVSGWCAKRCNRDSFPPIVINITDGEASDADYEMLRGAAARLKATGTNDGATLLVNVHISSGLQQQPILFPAVTEMPEELRYASLLMEMSSIVPEPFNDYVCACRSQFAKAPYVAMSYNASISEMIAMLNIGSRSSRVGI